MSNTSVIIGFLKAAHVGRSLEFEDIDCSEIEVIGDFDVHHTFRVKADEAAALIPLVGRPVRVTVEVKVEPRDG